MLFCCEVRVGEEGRRGETVRSKESEKCLHLCDLWEKGGLREVRFTGRAGGREVREAQKEEGVNARKVPQSVPWGGNNRQLRLGRSLFPSINSCCDLVCFTDRRQDNPECCRTPLNVRINRVWGFG